MSLLEPDADSDEPEEPKPTDYTYGIILAVMLPAFFYFRHIGKTDLGLSVGICLAMCIIAIRIRWDLRKRLWFWGIVAFVLALHVPLLLIIQWPHAWVPGIALLPIGLADVLIILGAVGFVEKFIVKPLPPDEEA
jgi:hypothetical protein